MKVISYEVWLTRNQTLPDSVCQACDGAHKVECGACGGEPLVACDCTNPGEIHATRRPKPDCHVCGGDGFFNCRECEGEGKVFCLECWGGGLSARAVYEAEVVAQRAAFNQWGKRWRVDDDDDTDPFAGLPMGVK